MVGRRGHLRPAPRAESRGADLQLHGRPDHGQQPDGRAPLLGPDAQGRLPAVQGAPRFRPALPERLRLPGALGRGRRRALAGAQLEAGDRGVRARGVQRALQGAGRGVRRDHHRPVPPSRHVDGLGQRLLHLLRHEHRVHLALPQGVPRARLALQRTPLRGVVPPLRDLALAARADQLLRGAHASLALRPVPAQGTRGRIAGRVDDDAVDAARQRRSRRQARRRVRA